MRSYRNNDQSSLEEWVKVSHPTTNRSKKLVIDGIFVTQNGPDKRIIIDRLEVAPDQVARIFEKNFRRLARNGYTVIPGYTVHITENMRQKLVQLGFVFEKGIDSIGLKIQERVF